MTLVTAKFMLLNVVSEEAGHHSFSHLNMSKKRAI